jgi:O-antigen/teichoic acid export membrane protein
MAVGSESNDPRPSRAGSFASAALLTYGTNLAVAFFSLLNVLIVSRVLGPAGRGDVVFVTAIAWFVSHLATVGVQEANANFGGAEPRNRPSLATNSVVFGVLFGIAAVGALAALTALFPAIAGESDPTLRLLAFGSLPLLILAVYLRFLAQADYAFVITNIAFLITPVANVVVNGTLAALDRLTVGTAVATWVGGQALGAALLVWYVARRLAGFGRPDWSLAKRTLSFGFRSHVGRIMLLGNYRLDQWILGAVSGSRELGLYSVAVAWAEALWYLPTALSAVQRPDVVRATREAAARQAAAVFRVSVVITAALAAAVAVAAPVLCVTLFGPAFRGSIDDLRILVLGALGVVALKQLGSALTAQRRPTLASAGISVSFVVTLVLDILLIPRYGGAGAAVASSVAYAAGGVALALLFARAVGGRLRDLAPRGDEPVLLIRSVRSAWGRSSRPPGVGIAPPESADEFRP